MLKKKGREKLDFLKKGIFIYFHLILKNEIYFHKSL